MTTLDRPPVPPRPERLFSVAEYLRMVEAGILTKRDKVELIEGRIVEKMPKYPPDVLTVELLSDALRAVCAPAWVVRVESPLQLVKSAPEPDVAIVVGPRTRYAERHPRAEDVILVVEVSDSTLRDDREEMASIYAGAGIPIYWIVNLADRCIEVYTMPTGPAQLAAYRQRIDVAESGVVELPGPNGARAEFRVKDLLSPRKNG